MTSDGCESLFGHQQPYQVPNYKSLVSYVKAILLGRTPLRWHWAGVSPLSVDPEGRVTSRDESAWDLLLGFTNSSHKGLENQNQRRSEF